MCECNPKSKWLTNIPSDATYMGKRKLRWIKDKRHMEAHSAHLTGNIAIKIQNMCFWFLSCIWSIDRKNCTPHLFLCLFCFFLVFSVNPWFFGNDRKHASNQTARIDTHFPHYLIFCYKTGYILSQKFWWNDTPDYQSILLENITHIKL